MSLETNNRRAWLARAFVFYSDSPRYLADAIVDYEDSVDPDNEAATWALAVHQDRTLELRVGGLGVATGEDEIIAWLKRRAVA